MLKASSLNQRSVGRFAFAALLALTFCLAHPGSEAQARKRRPAKYGAIQIRSIPAGLPLEIDGKSEGVTTGPNDYRSFDREPGLHTVVVTLPNGQRWRREIELKAGRIKCVDVAYHIHCWEYPITASISKTSEQGNPIVAYKANVNYDGPQTLKYIWTVNPASAKIVSGGTGSPDIAIDTAGINEEVKVSLLVDADDGSADARCTAANEVAFRIEPTCIPVSAANVIPSSPYYRPGDKVTFTARAEFPGKLNYKWTVGPSPATISEGDGTDSITVDTTGVAEDTTITASVVVDDDNGSNDAACPPARADASITCGADCGPVRNLNDLKARLDDFVTKLQANPGAEGLVYIYGPRKKAETVSNQARTYLVSERGIDASRVNVQAIDAGDRVHFEFFVVGRGDTPMQPDNRRVEQLEQPAGLGIQHVPGYPRHSPAKAKHRKRRRHGKHD